MNEMKSATPEHEHMRINQGDAKVFLAERIFREASLAGIRLSEAERKLLVFSDEPASEKEIPEELLDRYFDFEFDRKVERLLSVAYKRDKHDPHEREQYGSAVEALQDDDYMMHIAEIALVKAYRKPEFLVNVLILFALAAVLVAFALWK
jgi:hypothetical protein